MLNSTPPPQTTQEILNKNLRLTSEHVQMVTKSYLDKHPGLRRPFDLDGAFDLNEALRQFSVADGRQQPGEKKASKSLTAAYYQGIIGDTSVIRVEGSSNDLIPHIEVYGVVDLESKSKGKWPDWPNFETFFGELKLSKEIIKDLRLTTRLTSASDMEDIARLGLRYAHAFEGGDAISAEFYPLQTDGKQTLFLYGIKKMNDGRFFADLYVKRVLNDFKKLERYYSEIGCGVRIVKKLEGLVQVRLASNDYFALLAGLRCIF